MVACVLGITYIVNKAKPKAANDNGKNGEPANDNGGDEPSNGGAAKPVETNAVDIVNAVGTIRIAIFDDSKLDHKAIRAIYKNPAFITFSDIEDDVCRAFLTDTEPQFKDAR